MSPPFPIIVVPTDAAVATEAMGTKFKFWFHHPELGYCLYKQARPNTGEDWAEKIASQLCELLGLPHARIELATWNHNRGTVSPSFVPDAGTLIQGNEILGPMVPDYPQFQTFNVSQHTLDIVLTAISNKVVQLPLSWIPPQGITTAVETFVGYLLLDAWIGNSDRHHENWAFIETPITSSTSPATLNLAPTYDHASSLGRELLDVKRQEKLNNRSVLAYAEKCRSALYIQVGDRNALKPLDAFRLAAQRYPLAARVWLEHLAGVSMRDTQALFNRIPNEFISEVAIAFAQKILEINQQRLLDLQKELP
ncbi:hypothetical protein [Microseira wollei]|uniref:HipA-like protein n=1 Tax=Microseira wollei NIES-4236 TaxID=2530354 RepID=A0AAV3XEY1_9CYAN|nr:hypothetical protein [Microseira wollei]GET39991.1 hypothetical protein MiSe_47640 [Microseira wollei NIES-4236]